MGDKNFSTLPNFWALITIVVVEAQGSPISPMPFVSDSSDHHVTPHPSLPLVFVLHRRWITSMSHSVITIHDYSK
jgi:hypothetical protein